jgi:hypothetical protein
MQKWGLLFFLLGTPLVGSAQEAKATPDENAAKKEEAETSPKAEAENSATPQSSEKSLEKTPETAAEGTTDAATAAATPPVEETPKTADETPLNPENAAEKPVATSLPDALKNEERYDLGGDLKKTPDIDLQSFQKEHPEAPPPTAQPEDDFMKDTTRRVERLLVSNVGIQNSYRPAHRFGVWASYTHSLLSKALYRSSTDGALIDGMVDAGFGIGAQMDFSWVEKPNSPQPSNSSLRVRAGFFRAKVEPTASFLDAHDGSEIETAMNAFHAAFLLKNALPLSEGIRSWGGGGFFMNYVISTDRARVQADTSSKLLNSLAFGPVLAVGVDLEVGDESEILLEGDYQLWKSWTFHVGLKTSL